VTINWNRWFSGRLVTTIGLATANLVISNDVVSSNPAHDDVYSIQHYVIKSVSDLRQVGGTPGTLVSATNKTDRRYMTEKLLKVVLNTITLTLICYMYISVWPSTWLWTSYDIRWWVNSTETGRFVLIRKYIFFMIFKILWQISFCNIKALL